MRIVIHLVRSFSRHVNHIHVARSIFMKYRCEEAHTRLYTKVIVRRGLKAFDGRASTAQKYRT